jgi:hypothetical protein
VSVMPSVLVLILLTEFLLFSLSFFLIKEKSTRMFIVLFFLGLLFYSGIGGSFVGVEATYILYYFIFSIVFLVFFTVSSYFLKSISTLAINSESRFSLESKWRTWPKFILPLYFFSLIFPLAFPRNRLLLLLSPPPPDLVSLLGERFSGKEVDSVNKLISYLRLLITPFFFLRLYSYRKRPAYIFLLLFVVLYIQYVNDAYIGRGQILTSGVVFFCSIWVLYPGRRRQILLLATIAIVPLLIFFYLYQQIRINGKIASFSILDAVVSILQIEWAFPRDVGSRIISEGARENILSYIIWIFTLPIPKILTGSLDVATVNVDISKYVLGIEPGSRGFNIVLTGLVGESVFLFGKFFFWVHAVFIAFISALLLRLFSSIKSFTFLRVYMLILLIYNLNRAGIGAALSNLVNEFLLFYIFFIWNVFRIDQLIFFKKGKKQSAI